MILEPFIFCLAGHYLGDYSLQNDYMASYKRFDTYVLFAHAMCWVSVISIALMYFNILTPAKFAFLVTGHFVVDFLKTKDVFGIYIDQLLHVIQVVIVAFL